MKLDAGTKALLELIFYILGSLFVIGGTAWLWAEMLASL